MTLIKIAACSIHFCSPLLQSKTKEERTDGEVAAECRVQRVPISLAYSSQSQKKKKTREIKRTKIERERVVERRDGNQIDLNVRGFVLRLPSISRYPCFRCSFYMTPRREAALGDA